MIRVRRTSPEPRMEMMPLIDVVFLLLTFFIFSLVLLVRVDVLDISLPTIGAGQPATMTDAITIALDRDGSLFVNAEPVTSEELGDRVRAIWSDQPEATLVIAADTGGVSGDLLGLIDLLASEGLGEFAVIGSPSPDDDASPSAETDPVTPQDPSSLPPG